MTKKITIIGGSGFIGTNLCRQLFLKNKKFEIIDLKLSKQFPKNWKFGDVRDLNSLRETITGDIVVNLAAIHRDDVSDKSEYQLTNVVGSENVALACEEKGIKKIVFTSSVAVYGFAQPNTDENGLIKPSNEYGRTKFDAEEILRGWFLRGNHSLIIVRPAVVFGEGNRGNVFNLFNQIASGKFLMVGNGVNKKSMAYILNVVSFLEACIVTKKKYGIYNYVDEPNFSMNELVSKVRLELKGKDNVGVRVPYFLGLLLGFIGDFASFISNKKLPLSSARVKKFVSSTEFKSAKFLLDNFRAPFQLNEGLQRTLQSDFVCPDKNREIFYTE